MARRWWLFLVLAGCCTAACAKPDAEYAIRWSPKDGGPADLAKAATLLKIAGKSSAFAIRYFDVAAPADAPPGMPAILRERVGDDGPDITWKYRGPGGFPAEATDRWNCPLNDEKKKKRKDEIDVSILDAAGSVRRSYSRSCSAEGPLAKVADVSLRAVQKGCASRMQRRQSKDESLTVEQWTLANGEVVLELSSKGADSPTELKRFRELAGPLLAAGIKPLDRSKTEIGTQCR